jgi:hypothetical protein
MPKQSKIETVNQIAEDVKTRNSNGNRYKEADSKKLGGAQHGSSDEPNPKTPQQK